jgi:hypothetical protein
MTIHFSAAANRARARVTWTPGARLPLRAGNDNAAAADPDLLLRAALNHFAAHGLGAARVAAERATRAWQAGKEGETRHWLAICRNLDRGLATRTARHLPPQH